MVEWIRLRGVPLRFPPDRIQLDCVRIIPSAGHAPTASNYRLGLTTVNWTEQRTLRGLVRHHQVAVLMKNTMPEVVFRGVAAHELGHVWMMTESIDGLPAEVCEGFCELLAFLYYKGLGSVEGDRHARRIQNNPDPIYGGGFRTLFDLFERTGLNTICINLARTRSLPRLLTR